MSSNINARENPTYKDFLRSWGNPEQQYALCQKDRAYRYRRLWDLYQGTAFDSRESWALYRRNYGLYRATRQIWDHVHQLVEFYATHVWSGSLADDGLTLPDGVENAIPLASDTSPELAKAIGQLWRWWNFQEQMSQIVRYTAALGEFLVELHDDVESGKILINLVWPAYIKDIKLDASGNVKWYCIEYRVKDSRTGKDFIYRREVDGEFIETFKDDKPFDYTKDPLPPGTQPYGEYVNDGLSYVEQELDGAKIENPYGFVPAVWFRHHPLVGVRGEPAVWSTQAQLDEANELFAHLLDKSHVSLEAPIVVAGNIAPNALQRAMTKMAGMADNARRWFSEDDEGPTRERQSLNVLEGPSGTRVETIELKISEAAAALDKIQAGIEAKCPEITMYRQLRSMTQITGPAAMPLIGDVNRKVKMVAGGYDRSLIRLQQMAVSMAGFRLDEGAEGWENPSAEQEAFRPFASSDPAEHYLAGDLNHNIMPRDVVRLTVKDRLDIAQQKKNVLGDFIPPAQLAKELGYNDDQIADFTRQSEERQRKALELAQKMGDQQQEDQQDTRTRGRPGAPPGGPQRGSSNQQRRPELRSVR